MSEIYLKKINLLASRERSLGYFSLWSCDKAEPAKGGSIMSFEPAPVALFCYNRPQHLSKTLEALKQNELSAATDLFVFSDGAKGHDDIENVRAVREHLAELTGFKSVTVKEASQNLGLATSIISGVSEVVEKFGRVIVIEDDIVLSNAALQYFNSALEYYKNHQDVFSISAFNFQNFSVPPTYKYDTYFIPRMQCWGWATGKKSGLLLTFK